MMQKTKQMEVIFHALFYETFLVFEHHSVLPVTSPLGEMLPQAESGS